MVDKITKKNDSFIKDGIRLIGGQVFIAMLSIGNVIVTARALDVDGRGYLALALLFVSILCTFTEFGLGNAGTHFIATGKWTRQEILASHAFSVIVRCIVIGCIGIVAVFFFSEKIIPGVPVEYLYISIIQAPALLIASSILPLLLGIGLAKSYNRIQILSSVIGVGSLIIWWLIFNLDVKMALLINLLVGFFIATITWVYTKNVIGGLAKINFGYLAKAYRYGFGLYASNLISFANNRVIWLLINGITGAVGVGLYSIAQSSTERIYLVADAIGTVLFPKISEDPIANSLRITPVVFRSTIIIVTLLSIFLGLIADWVVEIIFSESYVESVSIIRILLIGITFSSGWRVLSQDINGRGKSGVTAVANGILAIIGLVLTLVLLSQIGLVGAAWAAAVAAFLSLIIGVILFGYYHHDRKEAVVSLFKPSQGEIGLLLSAFRR